MRRALLLARALALASVLACSREEPSAPPPEHAGHDAPDAAGPHAAHAGRGQAPPPGEARGLPPGHAEIEIAPDLQQLMGVKLARAERGPLESSVRASAVVQADETREAHVHSKVMGWVQELFVNAVGQPVKKGDPLYSLYSQELFAAQQEYVRARRAAPDLARVARQRLLLWDVPEDQIRLVERKGPQRAIVFRSPISGTVVEKNVLAGHFVEAEMMLYRIADLSQVWILASVYEYEVNRIVPGTVATIEVPGLAEPLSARVDYVYPTVDEASRTVRVRLVAPNARGTLRPGSFATVSLPTPGGPVVWVPDEAVIDTGTRQLVYLALEGGRFRPVVVRVGRRAAGKAEIREGLEGGEQVVVGAQFLVDSESRLRGVEGAAPGHTGH